MNINSGYALPVYGAPKRRTGEKTTMGVTQPKASSKGVQPFQGGLFPCCFR